MEAEATNSGDPWLNVRAPDPESTRDVVLTPGDVLYLPPGTWHQTEASEHSLSLTVALRPHRILDLAIAALRRGCIPSASARKNPLDTTPSRRHAMFEEVLDRLQDQLDGLRNGGLQELWRRGMAAEASSAVPSSIDLDTEFEAAPWIWCSQRLVNEKHATVLYANGSRLELTPTFSSTLEALAKRASFTPRHFMSTTGFEDASAEEILEVFEALAAARLFIVRSTLSQAGAA